MKCLSVLLMLFYCYSLFGYHPTTRLITPNGIIQADTSGQVVLEAFQIDVFREHVSAWSSPLVVINGGDSSLLSLTVDGSDRKVSLNVAIESKWVSVITGLSRIIIVPAEQVELSSFASSELVVSEEEEDGNVPDTLFKMLGQPIETDFWGSSKIESAIFQEVYNFDKQKSLQEFINYKLDTTKHTFWTVRLEGEKLYIHESLGDPSIFGSMPRQGSLVGAFGKYPSDWLPFSDYDVCLVIDSVTHCPRLLLKGYYKDAILMDVEYTSEYEVGGLIREQWEVDDDTALLEIAFWRKVDIETYYMGGFCIMEQDLSGTWRNDKRGIFHKSPCGEVKPGKVLSMQIQF